MYPEVLFPEVAKIYIDTHEEHSRFFLPEIVKVRNNYSWQTKNVNLSDWVDRLREFHNLIEIIKNKNYNRKKRQLLKPKSILAARQLIPLVSAGMHARWLEVESGICQCLNGSDIGSAALLVRGILEEADRCNLIQKDIKKLSLKKLKYSVEVEDLFQRLVLWVFPE